ncbi:MULTISPECIES: protein sorting system archaetidylserine synthase [Halobellus]|jgi:CDP-diacylglycerol--serine O-phosphatidyltransferase|uniref:protein sorting system archaetidylserine synthase n=1 Tax=Halobellus TaxID=1073986 RepID=UPI000EF1F68C|nr:MULTISPECIES: protein sorting system archaetidylserine synthase [Halobellus]MDQ2053539.1 protein sorting system archaetidylserine synthase [Halobellus sp. H-GB7]RLM94698.1 phosphatidylcholine/phosphatidylserine synthase [Halobellus sp. Atlit-38R]
MKPRFVGRLGLADAVTVSNAALGFVAAVATTVDVELAARILLLAAIADALDGVVARRRGGTAVGPYLDSLADVASFGVAPALLVAMTVAGSWGLGEPRGLLALVGTALFVAAAVTRLGLYTAYDSDAAETEGVQTTLAATILGATVLAGFTSPIVLVPMVYLLAALMLAPITYPDLHAQDALVMGVVQAAAILLCGPTGRRFVGSLGEGFAYGLLFLSLAYLVLGPRFYWRRD